MPRTCALLWLSLLGACSAVVPSVAPMIGVFVLDGDYRSRNLPLVRVDASFDELGLDDPEVVPAVTTHLAFDRSELSLSLLHASFEGDGATETVISFSGLEEQVTPVRSELDVSVAQLRYTVDSGHLGPVEWGLGMGLAYAGLEAVISDFTERNDINADDDLDGYLPLIVSRFAWARGAWGARLDLSGAVSDVSDDWDSYFDAELGASYAFQGDVRAVAGLRYLRLSRDSDGPFDPETTVELLGLQAGVRFSF